MRRSIICISTHHPIYSASMPSCGRKARSEEDLQVRFCDSACFVDHKSLNFWEKIDDGIEGREDFRS